MSSYNFTGKWITDARFSKAVPRNVFHKQLEPVSLPEDDRINSHILFRKNFVLNSFERAVIYITADDYYKLYVNGQFVAQGPAPGYHNDYNYNVIDLTEYLCEGQNVIAVHTFYQGLINRVWQSADFRHGLILDLVVDGKVVVYSDQSFLTHPHTAYSTIGRSGLQTQFLEKYDSNAPETDFFKVDFDCSKWANAELRENTDYILKEQKTPLLEFEKIYPVAVEDLGDVIRFDFSKVYVGYPCATAKGEKGDLITIKTGQELEADNKVRFVMRCCCSYVDHWVLSGKIDTLNLYDYKAFRYLEFEKGSADISNVYLLARHYPFNLTVDIKPEYEGDELIERIFNLCVNSQKYGVQETIQDCMDREKGFYLGDGCYSALANAILSGNDLMARKLIDDAFASSFIVKGLVTCMDCSFMQEIAEYPLILCDFILWHYKLTGNIEYLKNNYSKMLSVLDYYKDSYEKDGLLRDLDRWCVVEWPINFQDDYAAEIKEGQVCKEPHVAINAYYVNAVKTANKIAEIIGDKPYRDEQILIDAFYSAFYDQNLNLFVDGTEHRHVSLVGNVYPFSFGLCPEGFKEQFYNLLEEKGFGKISIFTAFPLLKGLLREGEKEKIYQMITSKDTWSRMLEEGATTTFEVWGKDLKWNTSLFHLTLSFVSMFIADFDLEKIIL